MICNINNWAARLHLGVYCELRVLDDTGAETYNKTISDHAILQATMIDALGDIFSMFVAAVSESRSGHSPDPKVEPWGRALRHGKEACRLLNQARDKLIVEATGSVPGKDLGPVITPEAIMLVLFERLAYGVYGTGTVDVINIFEECLEKLVSHELRRWQIGCNQTGPRCRETPISSPSEKAKCFPGRSRHRKQCLASAAQSSYRFSQMPRSCRI